MTPRNLAEVAIMTAEGEPFDLAPRNFLDLLYAQPDAAMLAPEPPLLRTVVAELGAVEDAYLAATAEWLATEFHLPLR